MLWRCNNVKLCWRQSVCNKTRKYGIATGGVIRSCNEIRTYEIRTSMRAYIIQISERADLRARNLQFEFTFIDAFDRNPQTTNIQIHDHTIWNGHITAKLLLMLMIAMNSQLWTHRCLATNNARAHAESNCNNDTIWQRQQSRGSSANTSQCQSTTNGNWRFIIVKTIHRTWFHLSYDCLWLLHCFVFNFSKTTSAPCITGNESLRFSDFEFDWFLQICKSSSWAT